MDFCEEAKKLKVDTLLDILRRTIANPKNAKEVAEYLAEEWNPVIIVEKDGKMRIYGF